MTTGANIAATAALIGDPGRANMLAALMRGQALRASQLADIAGVTPATASGHLRKLVAGKLLICEAQGRHRYYRLASADVARLLESLMVIAVDPAPTLRRATPRISPALRQARTCYDHLAGQLGVALADALQHRSFVRLNAEGGIVTDEGRDFLQSLGVDQGQPRTSRRPYCRSCMDWSERRPHIAGVLGAALLERTLALHWVVRQPNGRALTITPTGRRAFADTFDIRL